MRARGFYEGLKIVDAELGYKDTTGYFGIYINKPSNWIMRVVIEAKTPWVGFADVCGPFVSGRTLPLEAMGPAAFAPIRFAISRPEDLERIRDVIQFALQAAMTIPTT